MFELIETESKETAMNLATTDNPTMSSREMADLTEKRHDSVKRTIEMLAEKGVIGVPQSVEYLDTLGRAAKEYRIGKRDSYIIVAQLSPEFTAKLVDRWQALESKQAFQIPTTLSGALMLAAKQAEQIEQQSALIEAAKPKVEFHDTVCEAINAQSVEEVAKVLGTGRNRLFDFLRAKGIFKSDNLPYQDFIDRKYFRVIERAYKDKKGEAHTYTRTLVTGKGLAYIQNHFSTGANHVAA